MGRYSHALVHRGLGDRSALLGVWAAVCFASQFKLRGLARTLFVMPMMSTQVAVALVCTMIFHPQLGALNDLLISVGLPPSSWV